MTGRGLLTTAGLVGIALVVTGLGLLTAAGLGASVRFPMFARGLVVTGLGHSIPIADPVTASRDRSRSHDWSLLSSDCSRSRGRSWRSRRELRERVETVAVSQASVVSEVSAVVAPPVERGAASVFAPAVPDLARFFLSLMGSSSQGAVVGGTGATVSASGAGGSAVPFCSRWRGNHLWYCVSGFFSGSWASFRCRVRARFIWLTVACEGVLLLG